MMRWSEANSDMQKGGDRFFDNVVKKGINAENEKEERAKNLERFKLKP